MAATRLKDLQAQVGQLMIVGFDGAEISARVRTMLASLSPAGTILFKRNVVSAEQTYALNREAQAAIPIPLFRCVDLEGGTVDRLRDAIAPAPALAHVASAGSKKVVRRFARLLADESRALGFNTDFAPVFDLRAPESRKVLTTRTLSEEPREVTQLAAEFLKGFKDGNVLGCGKHFPGLGSGAVDSHFELPTVRKPWKQLWEQDLLPYRKLKDDVAFVMVAHCAYPDAAKDKLPASISRFWNTEVLRKKIGYKGLILADDLEMQGVQKAVPIEEAAVLTIRAGADMFLVCNNESLVWRTFYAVLREAERDKAFAKMVATASSRVFDLKRRARAVKAPFAPAPTMRVVDQLRRRLWEMTEEVRLSTSGDHIG